MSEIGILPSQAIAAMIEEGAISAGVPIPGEQIQPASIDLRLGPVAFRVQASFLPGRGITVADELDRFAMHRIDLSDGAVLERGCVYVVPLMERLALPSDVDGTANAKSSSGRLDLFTRLLTDGGDSFDRVPAGYDGPLYAEIAPRTFSVLVRPGARLNQIRFRRGHPELTHAEMVDLHRDMKLSTMHLEPADLATGLPFHVDLSGALQAGVVGYRARRNTRLVDVDNIDGYDPLDFWEPLPVQAERELILNPDDFYILASKEEVVVPPNFAAEMVPYDTLVGEFRVHYAGFFDPGFGWAGAAAPGAKAGARAVLEVRSRDVAFRIRDGQLVGRLIYERLTETPEKLYGRDIGSTYQSQGLKLGKQFKALS
ncbi:MAG: 2'-deoxycytidine 5'-triphosphate deaminase [Alphaproteobacteria bacterium]|nr:2'-deoxycytidine 5'-triphosphate deaminase [Alphaproteobacteria bacterium]